MVAITTMEGQDVVRSRLKLLIHERNTERIRHGKEPLNTRQIAELAGIAHSTLTGLTANRMNGVKFSTLQALCRFLNCTPGDILEYIPEGEDFRAGALPEDDTEVLEQHTRLEQGLPVTGQYQLVAAKSLVSEYQRKLLKDLWFEAE